MIQRGIVVKLLMTQVTGVPTPLRTLQTYMYTHLLTNIIMQCARIHVYRPAKSNSYMQATETWRLFTTGVVFEVRPLPRFVVARSALSEATRRHPGTTPATVVAAARETTTIRLHLLDH